MSSTIKYKGYIGSVEFSEEDNLLYGRVLGIRSLISYEGVTCAEIIEDFHEAVDNYLRMCSENKLEPETAYKGSFNVRISPAKHEKLALMALNEGITLNKAVERAIDAYIGVF